MSWYRSGIAAASVDSSSSVAGLIIFTRFAFPAPRILHGLAGITSSATAVLRMVRRSP